ncbi:MAG: ABC transporter ATP-binding protein, partial [Caldilineaceae bacterium]|nr:ABC transporter ATP-binding protein [Caldilineaceae bacterium]
EAMTLADRIALMQDGRIIQYAPPREIYNQPDDVFGGWFMGNPGMNFFEGLFQQAHDGAYHLPFFAQPLRLNSANGNVAQLTLGIRPEHVKVSTTQSGNAVLAQVVDRAIVIGGQTLLQLKVGELTCKAKLPAGQGNGLGNEVWVEFPLDRVRLFGADGHHPDVALLVS